MEVKQVKFSCPNSDTVESQKVTLGGIAVYDKTSTTPDYIICGCCGGIFKPSEVTIHRMYEWLPISTEIMGE